MPLLPQDDEYVYLSFKQGNGNGGKNRWFGRGNKEEDYRPDKVIRELTERLRQNWHAFFPTTLPKHPTLSGDWLLLARLPLAELLPSTAPAQRSTLKTLVLEKLAQAFVIAEKLRDESFQGIEAPATNETKDAAFSPKMTTPLNQILYGPPGTGKTFITPALTLAILLGKPLADIEGHYGPNQKALQQALAGYQAQGQTEFVTFHQAFGYEDFVEGIKPYEKENDQLGYRVEDGVFKRMCRQARQAWLAAVSGQPAPVALQLVAADFDELYERFVEDLRVRLQQGSQPQLTTRQGMPVEVTAVDTDGTLTLIHLNSAQFKHRVAPKWIRQIYDTYASVDEIKKVYEELRRLGGPNASLQWAIFNALKLFEQQATAPVAETADTTPQTIDIPRFVLVIDEINRGNVANIFGELITLLETDKRAGEDNELTVTLPYSKQSFSIPPNLYLLGTMNTADRSVEALDTALRRRFSFTEMQPDAQVLRDNVGDYGVVEGVDVARILEALNSRLEQLLDRDHCLGHALLLRVQSLGDLRAAFRRNILPLLQEYFFGDWGKIGLVLGEAFVQVSQPNEPGRYLLAKFRGYDATGPRERPVYRLADVDALPAGAFQAIYAV